MKNGMILVGCSIAILSLFIVLPSYATDHVKITITYPNYTSTIYGSNAIPISGTYEESNGTATPSINLSLDGSSLGSPSFGGGLFSSSLSALPTGYHTLTATISDQESSSQDAVTFLTVNGQIRITKMNLILINESPTCLALLKSNTPSDCPTLGELTKFDTSNPRYAGSIMQKPNGQWYRTPEAVKGWWNFIDNKTVTPIVCVQCDFDYALLDQVKLVFIEPHGFKFASQAINQNNTETTYYWNGTQEVAKLQQIPGIVSSFQINSDGYISPDCLTANLMYTPTLLQKTLSYLDLGCKGTYPFENQTLIVPKAPFDYNNPYSSLHNQNYVKAVLNGQDTNTNQTSGGSGPSNCITQRCNLPPNPYHARDSKFGWN